MAESKTYLNVPFAEKDTAKALGAKWEATKKKWYVPANKDIMLFAQWQTQSVPSEQSSTTVSKLKSQVSSTNPSPSAINSVVGIITQAADKSFVAYAGREPPWD